MLGDSTDAVWGVADVFPRTTFPDIRKKAVVRSAAGTLVVIPREGDAMVRFYIELPPGTKAAAAAEGQVTERALHERARLVFRPYEMEVAETRWWSAYAVGQRLAERFCDAAHRVFLLGDAAHTHSPKAGQGMNVSLQDGYNVGWKLGAHLTSGAAAELVRTYADERQGVAAELIEFDRGWSEMFKSSTSSAARDGDGDTVDAAARDASYVRDQFVKAGRYTAGQAYRYGESIVVWPARGDEPDKKKKGLQLVVGMRFPSAQVVRFSDARVFQLLSVLHSDRRWRIVVFDGDVQEEDVRCRLARVGTALERLIRDFTPEDADLDSFIEPLLVLKSKRTEADISQVPEAFKPITGPHRIRSEPLCFVFWSCFPVSLSSKHESDHLDRSTQSIL